MSVHTFIAVAVAVGITGTVAFAVGGEAVAPETAEQARLAAAERYVLRNRLLDSSCVLARRAETLEPLGACKDAFAQAHRIHRLRERDGRITIVDAMGSAVIDFRWNPETGMSSVASPLHPEAGALALLPVANEG